MGLERALADAPVSDSAGALHGPPRLRIDAAHPSGRRGGPAWTGRRNGLSRWISGLGQAILAIGLAASACGGSLIAWSAYASRPELWSVGIPIAIAGQMAMLIGLTLPRADSEPDHSDAGGVAEIRPYERIPGVRVDREGHVPEMVPSAVLLDLIARLEDLSKKLDRKAE